MMRMATEDTDMSHAVNFLPSISCQCTFQLPARFLISHGSPFCMFVIPRRNLQTFSSKAQHSALSTQLSWRQKRSSPWWMVDGRWSMVPRTLPYLAPHHSFPYPVTYFSSSIPVAPTHIDDVSHPSPLKAPLPRSLFHPLRTVPCQAHGARIPLHTPCSLSLCFPSPERCVYLQGFYSIKSFPCPPAVYIPLLSLLAPSSLIQYHS